jgi:hypothetical protein
MDLSVIFGSVGIIVGFIGAWIGYSNRRDAVKFRELEKPLLEATHRASFDGYVLISILKKNDPRGLWRLAKVKVITPSDGMIGDFTELRPDPVLGGKPRFEVNSWHREMSSVEREVMVKFKGYAATVGATLISNTYPHQKMTAIFKVVAE